MKVVLGIMFFSIRNLLIISGTLPIAVTLFEIYSYRYEQYKKRELSKQVDPSGTWALQHDRWYLEAGF
jgi:hypothetical protein